MTSACVDYIPTIDIPQYIESIQGGHPYKAESLTIPPKKHLLLMHQESFNPSGVSGLLADPRRSGYWSERLKHLYKCNPHDADLLRVIKAHLFTQKGPRDIRLAYIDMYPGHDPLKDVLTHAIKTAQGKGTISLVDPRQQPDILIVGPYSYEVTRLNRPHASLSIYYSGENSRPNYNYCQYSITHDSFSYCGRNFRFPYWMTEIDWFGLEVQHKPEERLLPEILLLNDQRVSTSCILERRDRSIVAFSSNPTVLRTTFMDMLQCRGIQAKGFGRVYGRRYEASKYLEAVNHLFCLAFENSLYPGYVTEKLFHAFRAGCIPLYWGDKEAYKDFHLKPELNLAEYETIDDYIEFIATLSLMSPNELRCFQRSSFISDSRAKIGPFLLWLHELIMKLPG